MRFRRKRKFEPPSMLTVKFFPEDSKRPARFLLEHQHLTLALECASMTTRRWRTLSLCCGDFLVPHRGRVQCFACGTITTVPEEHVRWELSNFEKLDDAVLRLLEATLDPLSAIVEGPELAQLFSSTADELENQLVFGPQMSLELRPSAKHLLATRVR